MQSGADLALKAYNEDGRVVEVESGRWALETDKPVTGELSLVDAYGVTSRHDTRTPSDWPACWLAAWMTHSLTGSLTGSLIL